MTESNQPGSEPEKMVRPFAAVLREIDNGAVDAAISARLSDLVDAVTATGKGGSVTLTVKVRPASKGSTSLLLVEGIVAAKPPAPEARQSAFFVHNGALTRDNPQQPELPLRDVSAPASLPIRDREAK